MNNPVIVVIAYNRAISLKRLLQSLAAAKYPTGQNVPLIISIDNGDNADVVAIADEYDWPFGEKRVVTHDTNLGLKRHVIECGSYADEFGSVIILEDDLYVSPAFYDYAVQALDFTCGDEMKGAVECVSTMSCECSDGASGTDAIMQNKPDDKVCSVDKLAGISLYNHLFNVNVREPFCAIDDGYDNYYMQIASSWGQIYTKAQWHEFLAWLDKNDNKDLHDIAMPQFMASWSDKSWLKYYIKYMTETDKYFLYPRVSLTTNFSDEGTHEADSNATFQVALAGGKREYKFSTPDESSAVYDAFFENVKLGDLDTDIDLYGYKPLTGKRYVLSSKAYPYKVIKSYGRYMRPIDANIINDMKGEDFFLYDTTESAAAPKTCEALKIMYNYRALNLKRMKELILYRVKNR